MFAVPNNEISSNKAYKFYSEKRPAEMKTDDAPFYLTVNNVTSGSGKPWFKKAPVGVNKLNTVMKTMAQKAGLGPNFKNHSRGRKTMIQILVNNDVPPADIMQLSGHKNVQSIINYSTVSQKQRLNMSHTLTGLSSGEIAPQSASSIPEKRKHKDELNNPTFSPTFSEQSKQAAQQPLSLFSGAVISGGHISVAINTLNQSPTALSVREETLAKLIKESNLLIRILTSVCQFKHAASDNRVPLA